jgi:hypothetical protein
MLRVNVRHERHFRQKGESEVIMMTGRDRQPQADDLSIGERFATTGFAGAQAIAHEARGESETEEGAAYTVARAEVEKIIAAWPKAQRAVAHQMLRQYGTPNEATLTKLFWYHNGPWKRTILASDVVTHNWPAPHSDFLTQVIDYRVPLDMVSSIVQFDGSVMVDRTRGEVAARCDTEAANILALNMVHEIVTGKRTVADARKLDTETVVAYAMGRAAPYAERLLFDVPRGGTADLDKPAIVGAIADQVVGKVKDMIMGEE